MLVLTGPASIGVAAAQVNLLVNTILATGDDGGVSALQYAFRLMYMPIGIIGVSVATAAIPELARQAADDNREAMRSTLSWSLRLMLMLSVPATAGLMVLAAPIIEAIFQRRAFDADSTLLVASALLFYAPGIVGYSIVKIASPCFYAMKDARTPIIVSLITIGVNLVLNLALYAVMGFRGLALGTAIAANLNAVLLLVLLSRRIGGIDAPRIWGAFVRIGLASGVMCAVAWGADAWLRVAWPGSGELLRTLRLLATITAAVGGLALAAWALRIDEFRMAIARVRGRLGV